MTENNLASQNSLKPSPKKHKWLFLILGFLVFFVLLGYGTLTYIAQDHALPFVRYQNQDIGLKSYSEITKNRSTER